MRFLFLSSVLLLFLFSILYPSSIFCRDLGRPVGASIEDLPKIALFHSYDVVEDVLPEPPAQLIIARFPHSGIAPDVAQIVSEASVSDKPLIQWKNHPSNNNNNNNDDGLYALVMLDPDAPTRLDPVNGQWMHWFVYNIPSSNIFSSSSSTPPSSDITKGADIAVDYAPPTPPHGSGPHRYIIALYKQSTQWPHPSSRIASNEWQGREQWNLLDYLTQTDKDAQLKAATFFIVENQ